MTKPNGQSVIEVLCVCLSLFLILKGTLLVFWLAAGSLWMDHQLYQKLICLAEGRPQIICRQRLLKNIKAFNPVGVITHLQIKKGTNRWEGQIKWTIYGISRYSRQQLIFP